MQTLIVGKSSMSVLISELTYIIETYTGVFLPGDLRFDLSRIEVEVEVAGKLLYNFYKSVCGFLFRLHVTQYNLFCYSN